MAQALARCSLKPRHPRSLLALLHTLGRLLFFLEVRLLLSHVPVQTLCQALKPVAHGVTDTDGGERVAGGSDGDAAEEPELGPTLWLTTPTEATKPRPAQLAKGARGPVRGAAAAPSLLPYTLGTSATHTPLALAGCPYLSPWRISCRFRPSKDTHAVFLASGDSMI